MRKALSSYLGILILSALLLLGITTGLALLYAPSQPATDPVVQVSSPGTQAASPPGILDRPVTSNPPTQLEDGHLIFWGVCMACHGNEGQGLTDEWREAAFGEDKDCWTSKCHASNHPPQGFEFPRTVPALVGGGRLGRFASAQQLYDYIVAMMPWWNPASLTPDKGWQVTAYLLELNGSLPGQVALDGKVASAIPVHRKLQLPENDTLLALIFTGTLSVALLGIILREVFQSRPVPLPEHTNSSRRRPLRRPGFVSHLHPPSIPAEQARWRYTLGAGGLAVFLCLVLLVTGLLEMFYYIPTPEKAAVTIETMNFFVPLGALVRNLHYWSAQLLVIVAAVHLLRVIFTGSYSAPRRFNFLLGMGMFVLVLLLDFTGYVLRWDEGIRWALTAGTNLLSSIPWAGSALYKFIVGGVQVGPATLVRFYAWHIFALSAVAAIILIWHLFRVRRDGGIAAPLSKSAGPRQDSPVRISRSQLLFREIVAILLSAALLFLLANFIPAPLAPPLQGDPSLETDTRAPWFFLWVQQLLRLGDPFLLGVLLPVGLVALFSLFPYIFPGLERDELGQWFPRRGRPVQIIAAVCVIAVLVLTLLALLPNPNG